MSLGDEMWRVAGLISDWYRLPGCDAGGPLHIITDDLNCRDSDIEWCRRHLASECYTDAERAAGTAILDGLAAMTEADRDRTCAMAMVAG